LALEEHIVPQTNVLLGEAPRNVCNFAVLGNMHLLALANHVSTEKSSFYLSSYDSDALLRQEDWPLPSVLSCLPLGLERGCSIVDVVNSWPDFFEDCLLDGRMSSSPSPPEVLIFKFSALGPSILRCAS